MFIRLLSFCPVVRFNKPLASNCKKPLQCVSLKNRSFQPIFDMKPDETLFCPFNAKVNKCSRSCNTFDYLYDRVSVPN